MPGCLLWQLPARSGRACGTPAKEASLPNVSLIDQMLLHVSTCKIAQISLLSNSTGRSPMPVNAMMIRVVSDRLGLAGEHLRAGDYFLQASQFRSAISRHYYAMYHAARAITFGVVGGDDHQQHSVLPRNLPQSLPSVAALEIELTDARLLRNMADYDPYPVSIGDWEADARRLSSTAASFVSECEDFALGNGLI